jgi:hypothetical protein
MSSKKSSDVARRGGLLWLIVGALASALASAVATASGPVPPELSGFAPLDQQELVDHFTGDFRYSVPLMEVPGPNGGYPIVLSYASGGGPDQDASWVGYGWTLSVGAIVRQMRGIPDDFAGDEIKTQQDIEPNVTYGLGIEGNYEIFGADTSVGTGLTAGLTGYFDNYRGFGITHTVGLSGQVKGQGTAASGGLSLGEDTLEGAKVAATASLSLGDNLRFGADTAFDATRGLSALSLSAQAKYQSASYLVSSGNLLTYLGYAKPAALPGTRREMQGSNIKVSFKMGGEVYGNYLSGKMFGYYNEERLKANTVTTKAYGFLHLDKATPEAALDFNRERDGAIHEQSPNLALPVLTHDLYVVSGRDLVGTFRAYRSDVPVVFDPVQRSDISGGAIGVDVGFGNVIKVGVAGALNRTSTVIKRWDDGGAEGLLATAQGAFSPDPSGYRERTYFKFIGEPSAGRPATVSGSTPLAIGLNEAANAARVPQLFYAADEKSLTLASSDARVPRATLIQSFTNGELRSMANALPEFKRDFAPLAGETQVRRDHHIGGFRITTSSGARHIYGIAVYNTHYEEQKFSVDRTLCGAGPCAVITPPAHPLQDTPDAKDPTKCLPIYDYRVNGSERMLEAKCLPAYPTSYLLTAILGADYIDADDIPGPSDGDYGYWVRFGYVRDQTPQGAAAPFSWRIPFVGASFVRGPDNGRYVSGKERFSDKGYVTFGQRESWYLASIETATHKAFMCTAPNVRGDAISAGSKSQNTPVSSGLVRPWVLSSVKLFAKTALAGTTAPCPSGTPLIEAHLGHDTNLALAKDTPNATKGKLTLRSVYFTHQDNTRGRLSPYRFEYEGRDASGNVNFRESNPNYSDAGHDRWGVYRDPSVPCGTVPASAAPQPRPALIDDEMPTCQEGDLADRWSAAWTLRRIVEPSGRAITVDYEADDYAFVQDRAATRLFRIHSVNGNSTGDASAICPVWSGPFQTTACPTPLNRAAAPEQRARVYFKLEKPFEPNDPRCSSAAACDAWVDQHYLAANRQLYFRIRVALKPNEKWQTVSGYAHTLRAGIVPGTDVGWVELAPVHSNYPSSVDYHPFAHAAWQYLRLEQPELIRTGGINGNPDGDPIEEAVRVLTLVDVMPDIIKMLTGVYPAWAAEGWGSQVDLAHSWIRLQDPDGMKKGGGTRVRRIRVSDGWSEMTANRESDLETGFLYSYRLEDGRSSGVASYEPMVAGEENALRQAKPFTDQVLLSSNYNLFAEMPLGESHYPSPVVGYSRVVRRTLASQAELDARASRNDCQTGLNSRPHAVSSGPTVYAFYTARDFPVRSAETPVYKRRPPLPQIVLIPLLGQVTTNSVTASQGYSTSVNDMHGKPRRIATYEYTSQLDCARPGSLEYVMREEPVTETTFRYRASGGFGESAFDLNNSEVATLVEDPTTRPQTIAEQSDFVIDLRHNKTESFDGGINLNVDTFLVAIYPFPVPVPMPNFGYSLSETRTVVTSLVTHRAGILDSVSVRRGSARIATRNERYDPLTGAVLLSASENAYGDDVYTYSMPAYWTYARMGASYEDIGRSIDLAGGTLDATGTRLTVTAPIDICTPLPPQQVPRCLPIGTELAVASASGGARLTLLGPDGAGGTLFAVAGTLTSAPPNAIVVRSGNRNLLSSTTDTIRALRNPLGKRDSDICIAEDQTITQFKLHEVLDAAHTTFADDWQSVARDLPSSSASRDEFTRGLRGIFRPAKDYAYVVARSQSPQIDLSRDGTFDFVMFGNGDEPNTCERGWVRRLTRTRYSASGFTTEDLNALEIPSAALYGAGGKLLVAAAANAKQDEIGYEGFESHSGQGAVGMILPGEGNIAFGQSARVECEGCTAANIPDATITTEVAHTGRTSLRVARYPAFEQLSFNLEPTKRYLISAWVSLGRVDTPVSDVPTYAGGANSGGPVGLRLLAKSDASPDPVTLATFEPDGPIIDGWQRIEGTFEAPAAGDRLVLQFLSGTSEDKHRRTSPAYFDDVRLLPESASFESYVYDSQTLRMIARLDENNFATFYRYTAAGKVDLIRRETVRGILTQQEGRLHTREQQP